MPVRGRASVLTLWEAWSRAFSLQRSYQHEDSKKVAWLKLEFYVGYMLFRSAPLPLGLKRVISRV